MGLLDEAIREHLELKRRRGADPSEVTREEHDALGPARRTEPVAAAGGAVAATDYLAREPVDPPAEAELEDPPELDTAPRDSSPDAAVPLPDDEPPAAVPLRPADDVAPGDRAEGDAAPPRDDVLDQTPDFLQETPEHDRLWFEQRPPRDFDFDG
ncbi:MAG: hypothetical protein H0U79_01820 [Solirubrobacterales bacterium]|nr:hypothetical protein [Solirubrobacterales bacterium]